ncbi:MAG: hypothetical protein JWQ50_4022 [Caballeronia mineralivorans]|jgi:hypothetical protein|nr:hypothetical protein [Caballeronia mineralivorans]MEA3100054.1 hypothetical protein [Caballeronia mineralivorans]
MGRFDVWLIKLRTRTTLTFQHVATGDDAESNGGLVPAW